MKYVTADVSVPLALSLKPGDKDCPWFCMNWMATADPGLREIRGEDASSLVSPLPGVSDVSDVCCCVGFGGGAGGIGAKPLKSGDSGVRDGSLVFGGAGPSKAEGT